MPTPKNGLVAVAGEPPLGAIASRSGIARAKSVPPHQLRIRSRRGSGRPTSAEHARVLADAEPPFKHQVTEAGEIAQRHAHAAVRKREAGAVDGYDASCSAPSQL